MPPHVPTGRTGTSPSSAPTRPSNGPCGAWLLRHGLARSDGDGMPAYLEAAAHNVPYYERFGFAVTRTVQFRSGPTVFGMLRPPS